MDKIRACRDADVPSFTSSVVSWTHRSIYEDGEVYLILATFTTGFHLEQATSWIKALTQWIDAEKLTGYRICGWPCRAEDSLKPDHHVVVLRSDDVTERAIVVPAAALEGRS